MANNTWVNRASVQVVYNTDASDMTERFGSGVDFHTYASNAEWIYDPDLSAVAGEPSKYWIITNDVVTLMSQPLRDAVDAAEEVARLDSVADELDRTQSILKAFAEVLVDELNNRADANNAVLAAAASATSLATFKTAMAAISDTPQRTLAQIKTAARNKL